MTKFSTFLILLFATCSLMAQDYNILDFNAVGDGKTVNTVPIQNAIDKCSRSGGGRVIIPAGVFVTGTIEFKDNVELHISTGATLKGSGSIKDYVLTKNKDYYPTHSLILAVNKENIKITGLGTIDGNGLEGEDFRKGNNSPNRPNAINFFNCRNIHLYDVTMVNSARWMQNYENCDYLFIRGVNIYNHGNYNNDGIDINGCRNVVMTNCVVDADDDGICLKSSARINENFTISNCVVASHCNAIKFGQSSVGGYRNISISNCVVRPSRAETYYNGIREGRTGISVIMFDQGINENIIFSDITIDSVKTPIYIKIADNRRNTQTIGSMKNIQLNNIIATNAGLIASSITGMPGNTLKNITLNNVDIYSNGGGTEFDKRLEVPENAQGYPDNRIFMGNLPASAIYFRHIENLQMNNVSLHYNNKDVRSPLVADDVDGFIANNINVYGNENTSPLIQLLSCRNARFSSLYAENSSQPLIRAIKNSSGIVLQNTDLTAYNPVVEFAGTEKSGKVILANNYTFSGETDDKIRIINENELEQENSASNIYQSQNIVDVINSYWELGDFARLMKIAGLNEWMREQKKVTVLAYGNSLIRATPTNTLMKWQQGEDKEGLRKFLKSLIVPEKDLTINDLMTKKVETASGTKLKIDKKNEGILINDYPVPDQNIQAMNGILHVLTTGN